MERFARDAAMAKLATVSAGNLKPSAPLTAMIPPGCPCGIDGKHILLEEFKLDVAAGDPTAWATSVASQLLPTTTVYEDTVKRFAKQLVVVRPESAGEGEDRGRPTGQRPGSRRSCGCDRSPAARRRSTRWPSC